MKRILILILAAVMMLGSSCSKTPETGTESTARADETTAAEEAVEETAEEAARETNRRRTVLSDWSKYLHVCEYLYGDMLWAISYIEQFIENPTWDNLQIARVALITATKYIEKRNIAEPEMTADDYVQMLLEGYDVADVEVKGKSFEKEKQDILRECLLLKSGLYSDIFWQVSYDYFQSYIKLIKEYYINLIQFLNITTEYLLLNLNDPALTDEFHSYVEENCPTLTAYQTESIPDMDTAYAKTDVVLEKIEAITKEMLFIVGESQAVVYQMQDARAEGDMTVLQEKAVDIIDMPLVLPYPLWDLVDNAVYYYYYTGEDNINHYSVEQETLSEKPDGWLVEYYQTSREDFDDYQAMLSILGLDPYTESEVEGEYRLTYYLGDTAFMLTWNEEYASFFAPSGNIDFVPLWYLE